MRARFAAVALATMLTAGMGSVAAAQTPGPNPNPTPTTIVQTERDDSGKLGLLGLLGLTGLLGLRRRKTEHVETARPVVGTASSRS